MPTIRLLELTNFATLSPTKQFLGGLLSLFGQFTEDVPMFSRLRSRLARTSRGVASASNEPAAHGFLARWVWPQSSKGRRRLLAAMLLFAGLVGLRVYLSRAYVAAVLAGDAPYVAGRSRLSFDFSKLTIPRGEIHSGGPPKDGIPALNKPVFVAAAEARFLKPDDRVIGVELGGKAKAYPLRILTWHEIVNDQLAGVPLAVTFCPLCDSVEAFDRRTPGGVKLFGVSGLLYNSNVLMFERGKTPEILCSQIKAEVVSGRRSGERLKTLPVELTTWQAWRTRHPRTQVLSTNTGHSRDYAVDPYRGYLDRPDLIFGVRPMSRRLAVKAKVLGVWTGRTARAYPLADLAQSQAPLKQQIDERRFTLQYDPRAKSVRVTHADAGVEWMYSLWFAWYAFHPKTEVFSAR